MRELKIALVGLGDVANAHMAAHQTIKGGVFSAVVEPRADRRVEVSQRLGVPGFADVSDMLAEAKPDAACVLTPCATHKDVTVELAEAGVHVLCEKPIALSLEDVDEMSAACARGGVKFQYASSYRFLPAIIEAEKVIRTGLIGDVRLVRETLIEGQGEEAFKPYSFSHYPQGGPGGGGEGLVDHGVHLLDVIPMLAQSPISSVLGQGDASGLPTEVEFALLRLENGAIGSLHYDQISRTTDMPWEGMFSQGQNWELQTGFAGELGLWRRGAASIHVHGREGALRIFHYANKLVINDAKGVRELPVPGVAAPSHFVAQLQAFVDFIAGERDHAPSFEEARSALSALLSIYESQRERRWIDVPKGLRLRG